MLERFPVLICIQCTFQQKRLPCTSPVDSTAKNVAEVIEELRSGKFSNIAERSGREQDKEDGAGLETLRRDGYM